ncbi:TlpA family protein disulfide reductase [Fimbriiglobus ruber]|uniref:Thiol:disulfide interchange protein n=1 Tax=Fimbriiglobus ruber TaxID=1908690 RepID=A0A225D220_9BACT|nr:TlpA disulfide reductase family protein [Fimbriiglobus ruber]OWK35650.1 Thiol:disulfide interchange protein [Fimbriiglobus ruber]
MRRLAASLTVLGFLVLAGRADDQPKKSSVYDDVPAAKSSPVFDALKKEFTQARAKHARELKEAQKAVGGAKTDAEKQEAQQHLGDVTKDLPGPKYAARFLEFAETHAKDPMAFDAAVMAFRYSARPATRDNTLGKALAYLQDNYASKPQIKQVVRTFEASKGPAGEALLREVLAKNPDHRIQGHACKALLAVTTRTGEKDRLEKLLKGKYADLFPDLSEGKPVPEIAAKNVHDKDVKLSDFRGKVVVLDIWATWCPHCRAMIPHERAMVERLKDKPFAIVSISMDTQKETLTDFLATTKMPWPQWWVGDHSELAEDWNIEYFPTVFVIDARGVIRHQGLIGDDLEKAVIELLKGMEKKKGK